MRRHHRILIVDDDEIIRIMMKQLLEASHFECEVAKDGREAISLVPKFIPHLIILDVSMPHMSGFEVCRILREDDLSCDIPIIFLSAMNEQENRVKGFAMGADDYVSKPFSYDELLARIKVSLKKVERLEKEKLKAEALEIQTRCDELTGLFNWRYFENQLKEELQRCRHSDTVPSLMLIDIDRLSDISNTYGFQQGNRTIVQIAHLIQQACAEKCLLARHEGGEYALLLSQGDHAGEVAESIRRLVEGTAIDAFPSGVCRVTVSLGTVLWNTKDSPERFLRKAEEALYSAKKLGKNRVASLS